MPSRGRVVERADDGAARRVVGTLTDVTDRREVELEMINDVLDLSRAETGLGMTAERLAHLCEPFNRLGRSGSGIEGVGIGLVPTRWLVVQRGGTLALHSTAEVGTTVEPRLPAV